MSLQYFLKTTQHSSLSLALPIYQSSANTVSESLPVRRSFAGYVPWVILSVTCYFSARPQRPVGSGAVHPRASPKKERKKVGKRGVAPEKPPEALPPGKSGTTSKTGLGTRDLPSTNRARDTRPRAGEEAATSLPRPPPQS